MSRKRVTGKLLQTSHAFSSFGSTVTHNFLAANHFVPSFSSTSAEMNKISPWEDIFFLNYPRSPIRRISKVMYNGITNAESHLQSLHSMSHHPQALMHAIVETDKLRVILVALSSDGTTHTKTKPRKLLSFECVRNKDRMAVELIVHITCPDILSILENIEFVVHTLVPKKYRLWNSNPSGACTRPVAVAVGPPGNILALDYDFDTLTLNLVTSHVTYPS